MLSNKAVVLSVALALLLFGIWLARPGGRRVDFRRFYQSASTDPTRPNDTWVRWSGGSKRVFRLYRDHDRDGTVDEVLQFFGPWLEYIFLDSDGDGVLDTMVDCESNSYRPIDSAGLGDEILRAAELDAISEPPSFPN